MHRLQRGLLAAVLAALLLAGCGTNTTAGDAATPSAATGTSSGVTVLNVGASPVPHAEILRFVDENLAAQAGLDLEIVEFSDYVQPNVALSEGQIDANFFQHVPYMTEFSQQRGLDLTAVADVHIEPLGIYSSKIESLQAVPEQAVVAIPNDPTNGGRALQLLAAQDLLTLKEGVGTAATPLDIVDNPKQLQIEELEAAQLPRALADTTLAVINTNYALEADLQPGEDALALEPGQDNPYANVLAVVKSKENDPAILKLAQILTSPEVKQFIEERYQGAVVPAF